MKKKITSIALLVCSVAICMAAVADLSGKWAGVLKFGDNELPLTYTFKVDGENLTGSVSTGQGDLPLSNGKIKGNDFTFSLDVNGTAMAQVGKFYGDSTTIDSEFNGMKTHLKLTRAK